MNQNPHYGSGDGGGSTGGGTGSAEFIYYFHPDHLGSTSFVTDEKGDIYQHMQYYPFGETWVEESTNSQRVPYLFTSKEQDQETGLYYFGARYYDARTSVWVSADPALGRFMPMGDGQEIPLCSNPKSGCRSVFIGG